MKRVLLDTHALLWWLEDNPKLGPTARSVIADAKNEIYVSAVTTWEISIKRSIGKLIAPEDMESIVEEEGFTSLPISLFHGDQAGQLPDYHKDPFDRMLIAQAQAEGLVIITCDEKYPPYKVRLMNAEE
ncbi:type II toxin-antitoxin system VapC family toxin [Thalassotalea fusca]